MTINPFHRNTENDKTSTFVVDRKFPHPDNLRLSTHALSVYIGGSPY